MNSLLKTIKTTGTTRTENGALTHVSSSSLNLDLFSRGAAYRSRAEGDVLKLFYDAYVENPLLALKTLCYIRDIREGQGERRFFRVVLRDLANKHPEIIEKNFNQFVEFGRWDDVINLVDTKIGKFVAEKVQFQLIEDLKSDKPSLLGKWAPSINTSSKSTRDKANKLCKLLNIRPKFYRQSLSNLREKINIVENNLRTKDYAGIDYSKIPSRASFVHRKAFKRNDTERYDKFLTKVETGEVKINASALYPYDLVRAARKGGDRTVDAQWNALPDYLADNPHKGLVIADVSGSMTWVDNPMPLDAALSLAIYFAERNVGPFKDHCMSFSESPILHHIVGTTLADKYNNIIRMGVGGSTNLQAAFDLILNNAVKGNVSEKDMPSVLYIISDMEFNEASGARYNRPQTNYELIEAKYKTAGYALPKVVFWNVAARNDQSPVKAHDRNTVLVSGYSPTILKTVLSGSTPMQVFLNTVNVDRYANLTV